MGMLFNTEATTRMVALVNRHFGSDESNGGIESWRQNKSDINPGAGGKAGNSLQSLAWTYGVLPEANADSQFGKIKARWRKWLNVLQSATGVPADGANDQPIGGVACPWIAVNNYLAPKVATYSNVDLELRRQLFNALNDKNCLEIAFTVVPSTSVSIAAPTFAVIATPGNAGTYVCAITVRTQRVDDL